ncbi:hypothetical protein [Streptomyces sp. NBC_01268]|uniref:hypothetical protein n=1 Tax=Streptomyces sp. NBC_01268 TaxID=2903806 RepID=UPI002E30FC2D|nr:hypothetical protein [Streptomyces sp. NBC_01268]
MTDASRTAWEHLRDTSAFQWYVIPLLLIVLYVYAVEVERRNWNVFFAGLAFWGMDWFNEIWNALVFHFTGRAPVWGAPGGESAYLVLIGLNIEICFMFAVFGVVAAKLLPTDRNLRVLGLPNRWVLAGAGAAAAVVVEIALNAMGALTWEWSWWRAGMPLLVWLVGYLPFFLVSYWVHDLPKVRSKALAVGALLGLDALALIVFISLGWI